MRMWIAYHLLFHWPFWPTGPTSGRNKLGACPNYSQQQGICRCGRSTSRIPTPPSLPQEASQAAFNACLSPLQHHIALTFFLDPTAAWRRSGRPNMKSEHTPLLTKVSDPSWGAGRLNNRTDEACNLSIGRKRMACRPFIGAKLPTRFSPCRESVICRIESSLVHIILLIVAMIHPLKRLQQ